MSFSGLLVLLMFTNLITNSSTNHFTWIHRFLTDQSSRSSPSSIPLSSSYSSSSSPVSSSLSASSTTFNHFGYNVYPSKHNESNINKISVKQEPIQQHVEHANPIHHHHHHVRSNANGNNHMNSLPSSKPISLEAGKGSSLPSTNFHAKSDNFIVNNDEPLNSLVKVRFDRNTSLSSLLGQSEITADQPLNRSRFSYLSKNGKVYSWPVKRAAEVNGDVILGGLMMVHQREDRMTCGEIMPQGGIQVVECMLYTLDWINNQEDFLPGITLGAYILDDCDKDTYGLEQAVDFIKGKIKFPLFNHINGTRKKYEKVNFALPFSGKSLFNQTSILRQTYN